MALTLTEPEAECAPPSAFVEPSVSYAATTRRVSRADVEQMRHWLCGRLVERYPAVNRDAIYHFLVQAIDSNEHCFVMNDRAVGLAMIQTRPLRPARIVEMFCFGLGRTGDAEEMTDGAPAASLYPTLAGWGRALGAREFHCMENSDATQRLVEAAVGELRRGSYRWVEL